CMTDSEPGAVILGFKASMPDVYAFPMTIGVRAHEPSDVMSKVRALEPSDMSKRAVAGMKE
nr:arachin N term [Arachis hypogaea]